jgi:hypothetical protein
MGQPLLCGEEHGHEFAIRSHQPSDRLGRRLGRWLARDGGVDDHGDWTVLQGLFAAAVIFFGLGAVLSLLVPQATFRTG